MNLQQLYYFKKLAEEKQFTKAAQALYISQPSLSKGIKSLEESLNVKLFKKSGRMVHLTPAGEILYEHASTAIKELERAKDLINEYKGTLSGELNIGCIPTLVSNTATELITDFETQTKGKIKVNMYQAYSTKITKGIKDGTYDLGFCNVPKDESDFSKIEVSRQHLRLAVPIRHKYANRMSVSLKELQDDKLISYRADNYVGDDVKKLAKTYKLSIEQNYDDEIVLCATLLKQNKIALLLDVPDIRHNANIKLIAIDEIPDDFHPIYLVFKEKNLSRSAELFIDFIRKPLF